MKLTLKNEAQFDLNKWKVIIKENLRTEEIIVQIIKLPKRKTVAIFGESFSFHFSADNEKLV